MVPTFESVLYDHSKQWIVELTYSFNDQESFEDSRRVTMDAIDQNWKPVMIVPVCAGENPEPKLMNPIETVRASAEKFVNYREALKIYIEKLMDNVISSNLFDSSESEKIQDLFWKVEMRHQTVFEVAREEFSKKIQEIYSIETKNEMERISEEIIKSHSYLSSNLLNPNYK